jgi:hypothetical protein
VCRTGELADLHPSEREARRAALDALAYMRREGLSLNEAAERAGATAAAVFRHTGHALEREHGRYSATQANRPLRVMAVLGTLRRPTRSRSARLTFRVAGRRALVGDRPLPEHRRRQPPPCTRGETVAGIPLETDRGLIDDWERRGELEIDDIHDPTS